MTMLGIEVVDEFFRIGDFPPTTLQLHPSKVCSVAKHVAETAVARARRVHAEGVGQPGAICAEHIWLRKVTVAEDHRIVNRARSCTVGRVRVSMSP
jgi:hypothetical protein